MDFGKRLLPDVVDYYARNESQRVYASIPRSTEISDGFIDITMEAMAMLVNRMAWRLDEIVGPKTSTTIAYVGQADLRYPIIFLAALKTGHQMLFVSPRNTNDQNAGMLLRTDCGMLFYAEEMADIASSLKALQPSLLCQSVMSFAEILAEDCSNVAHYPLERSFSEVQDEQCLILHSSGSTGNPKLVKMTHGTFAVTDRDRYMPTPQGRKPQNGDQFNFQGGGRFFSCFPPYHLAGVQAYILQPIFSTTATVVLGPPTLPPSGYMLADIMKHQSLRAFYVPPLIIEQWMSTPESQHQARNLDFILFGGGPLSPAIGEELSRVTNVCQMYGSLETGQIQLLIPRRGEWSYLELNPFEEVHMQPAGEGVFEMVLHQSPHLAEHRSLAHNFPETEIWRTGDLFAPHPTKSGLWRFDSRIDDMIILSTGHKIRPLEMETIIQGHPLLSGALIVGQGNPQPLLLLEPRPGAYDGNSERFIDAIWPFIKQANDKASSYGQLTRSKMVISDPDRPFKRAPKGTIVRKLTAADYQVDIEAAFSEQDPPRNGDQKFSGINAFMLPGIRMFIESCLRQVMPDTALTPNDNIFLHGLDSLRAAELGRKLRLGLAQQMKIDLAKISLRLIYRHPTIEGLASAILDVMSGVDPDAEADQNSVQSMKLIVEEFTRDLEPFDRSSQDVASKEGIRVVLIGPRGSLGPYVVRSLLQDPRVSTVYCLSRGEKGRERLTSSFNDRGLTLDTNDARLVFMPVDLSKPKLGLSKSNYNELLSHADVFIHNAWKVDFSLTLDSYKVELIRSIRELVDLTRQGACNPRAVFISSISTVQEWARVYTTPVAEEPLPTYEVVSPLGYGQSKHVSERILVQASQKCDTPVTILRVGQVAGPTDASGGHWSTDEWIPSVATISKTLKLIPNDIPQIDWIPVNLMASAICEAALPYHPQSEQDDKLRIYNLVNPCLSPWSLFAEVLRQRLGSQARLVPLKEWVESLASTDPQTLSAEDAASSMKILPFFQHLAETAASGTVLQPLFETGKARTVSETMRRMKAIDPGVIEIWCQQWGI